MKISQLMFAAGLAAAALVGFGGTAGAASPPNTAAPACDNGVVTVEVTGNDQSLSAPVACDAPVCVEGALTTVVDDNGVQHEACVASAPAAPVAAVPPALESNVALALPTVPLTSRPAQAGNAATLPKTGAGTTGGLVIAALLVGSGSVASLLSRRRT